MTSVCGFQTSKVAMRHSKKQTLTTIAAFQAKDKTGGLKINESRDAEARVAHTLQSLNATIRRLPRKHAKMQPPPDKSQPSKVVPGPNSTASPNVTPINTDSINTMDALNNSSFCNDGFQLEMVRKERGKAMMKTFSLTSKENAEVEFNYRGQPIGSNYEHLSSYLGTLARGIIPVTIIKWKKIDKDLKKELWTCTEIPGR